MANAPSTGRWILMGETKCCVKCKQVKPLIDFNKDSSAKDGRRGRCKECRHEYNCEYGRLNYLMHPEKVREQHRIYRAAHGEEEREQHRNYRVTHKEEIRKRKRIYEASHRRKTRIYSEEYREKMRERQSIYYKLHGERIRERVHAYQKAYPEIDRARVSRRYARKLGAFGANYTTTQMIEARREYYGNRCWICGDPAQAMDHVKPLIRGGAHLPCNLRPICTHCNTSKHDKWPFSMPAL